MTIEWLKQYGNDAAKTGDFEAAINIYTYAIAVEPENHILYSNRSNFYYQAGRYEDALADAYKVIDLNPYFIKGYLRKSSALYALGRIDEAFEALNAGDDIAPDDESLYKQRDLFMEATQREMQLRVFGRDEEELRQKMIANPRISQRMVDNPELFDKINASRTTQNFLQSAQKDKDVLETILELMGIGQLAANMEREQAAEEAQKNAENQERNAENQENAPTKQEAAPPKQPSKEELTKPPILSNAFKDYGNELFAAGKYEEAIAMYNKAFQVQQNITYINNISTALLKQGKYEEAAAKAQEAYDFGTDNPGACTFYEKAKALAKKGSALHKLKRYEEAIEVLKQSMLEHRDKATLAILNKVYDEFKDFKMMNMYSSEQALDCKNDGNQLVKDGKFLQAIEKFTEGIKHLPVSLLKDEDYQLYTALHNNRSLALFKAAQFNPSYDDCLVVLQYDAKNVKALLRKAYIERVRKQYYLSIETYTYVLKMDPTNAEAKDGHRKTMDKIEYMYSGLMPDAEIQEISQIAMADESIQGIAKDPGMAQVLYMMQADYLQAYEFLKDPIIGRKLYRLIHAGVLRIGPPVQK